MFGGAYAEPLAVASIILAAVALFLALQNRQMLWKYMEPIIDELTPSALTRKRTKRVKRYLLVKAVCSEGSTARQLAEDLSKGLQLAMGLAHRTRCEVSLISFRRDAGKAIIRVVGDGNCVKEVLLTLSIQHLLLGGCILVPLKTSGLLSRLRKALH